MGQNEERVSKNLDEMMAKIEGGLRAAGFDDEAIRRRLDEVREAADGTIRSMSVKVTITPADE